MAILLYILSISVDKTTECWDSHKDIFEEKIPEEGDADAAEYVDYIVVGRVDGCPPDAEADYTAGNLNPCTATEAEGVDERHEHVGGMERRHGRKDIGVTGIQAVENAETGEFVETPEACDFAGGAGNEVETMRGYVPGGRSGVDVISGEAEEVDQEEYEGEMQISFFLLAEEEMEAEDDGNGHPAEVEEAGEDVGPRCVMYGEKFVGCQAHSFADGNTEKFFFS